MPTDYEVKQGDSISSIAFEHGFLPETIWDHEKNTGLKGLRQDPNVLLPGDIVVIPDKTKKMVDAKTGLLHRFQLKGKPEYFRLQLRSLGKPRAGVAYTLEIDDTLSFSEKTDPEGWIEHVIPPDAKRALLKIGEKEVYKIKLGGLDPVSTESGIRSRLVNLRFLDPDDASDEALSVAKNAFRAQHLPKAKGDWGDADGEKLREIHGS